MTLISCEILPDHLHEPHNDFKKQFNIEADLIVAHCTIEADLIVAHCTSLLRLTVPVYISVIHPHKNKNLLSYSHENYNIVGIVKHEEEYRITCYSSFKNKNSLYKFIHGKTYILVDKPLISNDIHFVYPNKKEVVYL